MSFSAPFTWTARASFALLLPDPHVCAASGLQPGLAACNATGVGLAWLSSLLILIFFFPAACAADIAIEPRIGFHGVFQLGHPFPLEVAIANTGRSAEGKVDVRVWKGGAAKGGAPYPLLYRREIFVPAQARKTVEFTVDPDFISRPLTITFSSPAGESRREVDLRRYFSPFSLLLFSLSTASSFPP